MSVLGETSEYPFASDRPGTEAGLETDESLAVRAAADPQATEEPYRRYVNRVYGYCKRRLGDEDAARDATGAVMLKALEGLYRGRVDHVSSWIFSIAHNQVVSAYRQRHPTIGLEFAVHVVEAGSSPETQAIASATIGELRTLLAPLSSDQQQVVSLRLAGLDGSEICAVLGRSRGWVDTTQYRAVRRLRELMHVLPSQEGM
jgi:RNA polymerase sigma-70 factor (ECF subfamily)